VPQQNNLLGEAAAAARGVVAVVIGDRQAARFFNLTTHGLAGSFIALLIVVALLCGLPLLFGLQGLALYSLSSIAVTFLVESGCAAIVLLQCKRIDAFVPYLVANNWASVYVTAVTLPLSLGGIGSDLMGLVVGVLIVLLALNIGRLIIGLTPIQVGMLVVSQVVAYYASELLVSLLPLPGLSS